MRGVIAFRFEAGGNLGIGHLTRCLALAHEAVRHGYEVLAMVNDAAQPVVKGWSLPREVRWFFVSERLQPAEDALWCYGEAKAHAAHGLVVDGSRFGHEWEIALPEDLPLVRVDDLGLEYRTCARLIVNQNLYASPSLYPEGRAKMCLGPRYAIIRDSFRVPTGCKSAGTRDRILVSFGGSDPLAATEKVIRALRHRRCEGITSTVVLGPAFHRRDEVHSLVAGAENRIEVRVAPGNFPGLFAASRFAVVGCGVTLLEALFLRVPFIALKVAEDQAKQALALSRHLPSSFLGAIEEVSDEKLAGALVERSETPGVVSSPPRDWVIDGFGAIRVMNAILEVLP